MAEFGLDITATSANKAKISGKDESRLFVDDPHDPWNEGRETTQPSPTDDPHDAWDIERVLRYKQN